LLQPTKVLRVRLVKKRMIIQPSAPEWGAAAVQRFHPQRTAENH